MRRQAMTREELEASRPDLGRGDAVTVTEEGIGSWSGTVGAIKPSSVSGWWLEIEREDGITFSVHESRVTRREEAA